MTLQPIFNASPVVQAHVAFALTSVVLGLAVFSLRKGTALHKITGRIWVVLMASVALGSFWIRSNGSFSWIHILSVVVLVNLVVAIALIRNGKVRSHQRFMIGNLVGLLVAGAFTLLPTRLMNQVLFGV